MMVSGLRHAVEFEFTNENGNTAVIRIQEPSSWTKTQLTEVFDQVASDFTETKVESAVPSQTPPPLPEHEVSPWAAHDEQRKQMHGKVRSSIDQVLLAVSGINERGPAASYDDICKKAHISYATVTKMFRADHPQHEYIGALFRVTKQGRSFMVDLTQVGRTMASRIRAGAA